MKKRMVTFIKIAGLAILLAMLPVSGAFGADDLYFDFNYDFETYYGSGYHNIFSGGMDIMLGFGLGTPKIGINIFGNIGAGIGIDNLFEWNYALIAEIFSYDIIGLSLDLGVSNADGLLVLSERSENRYKSIGYFRATLFTFINETKFGLYGTLYENGDFGFGIRIGWGSYDHNQYSSSSSSSSQRTTTSSTAKTLSAGEVIGMTASQLRSAIPGLQIESNGNYYYVENYPNTAIMSLFEMENGKVGSWTVVWDRYSKSLWDAFIESGTSTYGQLMIRMDNNYVWLNLGNNGLANNLFSFSILREDINGTVFICTRWNG
ncbi:hypothetical protein FACS1894151_02630 [Spirochaetia bacterium]|nr:hypothetical protein FACS1894151_02630 [Spirochaetia bacterium]